MTTWEIQPPIRRLAHQINRSCYEGPMSKKPSHPSFPRQNNVKPWFSEVKPLIERLKSQRSFSNISLYHIIFYYCCFAYNILELQYNQEAVYSFNQLISPHYFSSVSLGGWGEDNPSHSMQKYIGNAKKIHSKPTLRQSQRKIVTYYRPIASSRILAHQAYSSAEVTECCFATHFAHSFTPSSTISLQLSQTQFDEATGVG
ncbi:hypothetical protein F4803DRAFT_321567 [Xylaria telfairii]|nr:hypothetical protein F4803DRAFT_321567 [Xylaria telfairii]